jgi:hypothetical protein
MYTNPSDYFMGLMKDSEASTKLIELWRKAGDECNTSPRLSVTKPATPFAADDGKVGGCPEVSKSIETFKLFCQRLLWLPCSLGHEPCRVSDRLIYGVCKLRTGV